MGDEVSKKQFSAEDHILFNSRLERETIFVRQLFADRSFSNQTRRLGYELELCLLDGAGDPAPLNQQILQQAGNDLFDCELAKYNLEINGHTFDVDATVFDHIEADLTHLYNQVEQVAATFDVEIGLFGVLPSLDRSHLQSELFMSELYRYEVLNRRLIEMRQRPVHLELHGSDHLQIDKSGIMLEALGTSLQTHYQIPFDEAVDSYHAALWASLVVMAVSANSPLVMGKHCWQESRIAIFKQAVDTRNEQEVRDAVIPRVHFGKGYIESWLELFEDNRYYSPILPEVKDTPVENLRHFNLHNGTIWRWVRPILGCDSDGYHLRLELRVTPSGPTLVDTLANMVFYIGLIEGLKQNRDRLTCVPFGVLEQGFYQVARIGLGARVGWYDGKIDSIGKLSLHYGIPLALQGLQHLGISAPEKWLDIIRQRVIRTQTGADWIVQYWRKHQNLVALVKCYQQYARQNIPVHLWPRA